MLGLWVVWLYGSRGVEGISRPSSARRGLSRRSSAAALALPFSATLAAIALPSAALALPWNPLGLRGQFWETGNLVYVKGSPPDEADARERIVIGRAALVSARAAADAADADGVADALQLSALSERTLRRDGAALASVESAATRLTLAAAISALEQLESAIAVRRAPAGTSELAESALISATATGLVYLIPPAAVSGAFRMTKRGNIDSGLALLVAYEDMIKALDTLLTVR